MLRWGDIEVGSCVVEIEIQTNRPSSMIDKGNNCSSVGGLETWAHNLLNGDIPLGGDDSISR